MADANDERDRYCDPNNPVTVKFEEIVAAQKRLNGVLMKTPCKKAHMSAKLGLELYLKLESLHYSGSFKERGVRNVLATLSDEQRKAGVITSSTGNNAIAMSYHACLLNIPCIVVMPVHTPVFKPVKCKNMGAKVILHGDSVAECRVYALRLAKEKKYLYINGTDHPFVVAGQGTVGIEIIEQLPDVDAILCPCGGGSILAGLCVAIKHLKPDCEVYGVETDKTCSMLESLKRNERIYLDIHHALADGLAVNKVGVNSFYMVRDLVDKMIVVKEEWVSRAIMRLVEIEKTVACGAGATTTAAVMAGLCPNLKGKKVVCILSGGNIAATNLSRNLEHALAAEGRLVKFKVTVGDRPGAMVELCTLLTKLGVILRDCVPARSWTKANLFTVELKLLCETKGWDQTQDLVDAIKKNYTEYLFAIRTHNSGDYDKSDSKRRGLCLASHPECMQK